MHQEKVIYRIVIQILMLYLNQEIKMVHRVGMDINQGMVIRNWGGK